MSDDLRKAAELARSLRLEIRDLEGRLEDKKRELTELLTQRMPDMMDRAGSDAYGLPASGNLGAVDLRLVPFFRAGIPAKWTDEKKAGAFRLLERLEAGDLIKTEVVASLPRGSLAKARELVEKAADMGVECSLTESVHSATLTAWLKEVYLKRGQALTQEQLEAIGGVVGRVVKIEERDE